VSIELCLDPLWEPQKDGSEHSRSKPSGLLKKGAVGLSSRGRKVYSWELQQREPSCENRPRDDGAGKGGEKVGVRFGKKGRMTGCWDKGYLEEADGGEDYAFHGTSST